jgi:hypothetical protein
VWKTASKTTFASYPTPATPFDGEFQACVGTESKAWVMSHNIVAVFPDYDSLVFHDLCLKSGSSSIVVTVYDACTDSDCNGCCTHDRGTANELIEVESFTDARWGVANGPIQWADLGPTTGAGCH